MIILHGAVVESGDAVDGTGGAVDESGDTVDNMVLLLMGVVMQLILWWFC